MKLVDVALVPYFQNQTANLRVKAELDWTGQNTIQIKFSLIGDISHLTEVDPSKASIGARRDGLWEATCFEAFLSDSTNTQYWELNVNSKGDWNVFHFEDYRKGKREELRSTCQFFGTTQNESQLSLECAWDVSELALTDGRLGVTMIANFKNGEKNFFALSHESDKPDFHNRSSFRLLVSKAKGVWK